MANNYFIYASDKYFFKRGRKVHKVYHFVEDGKPFIYDCDSNPIPLEDLKLFNIDFWVLKNYKEKKV